MVNPIAKQIRHQHIRFLAAAGVVLLGTFAIGPSAHAESGLVVKLYACPAGQTASTAEALRNEYGVIAGVRVAADERTSRVVVQAPPEVQSRISQRMSTAFPDLQPVAAPSPVGQTMSRRLTLLRIKPDQFEAALWSALGTRLTAIAEQRAQVHGYRLGLSNGGAVSLWIDLSSDQVTVEGSTATVEAAARLVQALDAPQDAAGKNVRLMPLHPAQLASVEKAASIIRNANGSAPSPMVAQIFQPRTDNAAAGSPPGTVPPPVSPAKPDAPAVPPVRPGDKATDIGNLSRIVNPVQMEVIEGLDVLVLKGSAQDLEQMMEVVRQIERISAETEPAIEILPMKNLDCDAMSALVKTLYDEVYMARQGAVTITPMVTPNAILIVGRPENVKTVKDLVARLDQPTLPGAQFQVFHLRYAAATAALATVQNFFVERGGLSPVIHVSADQRSNALIVQASPRDMTEVSELIRRIDVITTPGAVNEVRIIRLEHTLAQDIASIIQSAIGASTGGIQQNNNQNNQGGQNGQFPGGPGQGGQNGPGGQGQGQNPQGGQGGQGGSSTQRAAMLRFLTVDAKGRKLFNSGILTEVRITADVKANALVISSPPENLELLEALVRQLDTMPAAEAQIKVFTVVNGDATNLSDMLRTLFTGQSSQNGQQNFQNFIFPQIQNTSSGSDTSLVPLRFGVDTRTNSVIASGTMGDLNIVEAILTKLDDGEVRHRKSIVIRLKNSPAVDVANTINTFLTTERQMLQQAGQGLTSAFEQIEKEVVVVAEPDSNSLVLSATPRFYEEVRGIIDQLDARPPMVMIQVMIASIELGDTNEFGIEVGLQDSVLFDRSVLSNLQTTTTTLVNGTSTQQVVSASGAPGFNFNNGDALGNNGLGTSLHPTDVGGQGLSNFATGRTNNQLGYGGLVLSAASENVSALLRALSENHRVEVLQRPQIMTLDNQPARIQIGKRVPRITNVTNNALTGNVNSITLDEIGLILGVTPRISPDGLVVMQIDAEKSELESEATGIPIFTSPTGQVTRSPIVDTTTAQTTVAAMSEQTVVLGGLITKTKNQIHRSVPVLGDIPLLGNLFRFDSTGNSRTELLIIMTPHIIKSQSDAEAIKLVESAKMSWCMCDVTQIYGEAGLRRRCDPWADGEVRVIYPDANPTSAGNQVPAEIIPTPTSDPASGAKPMNSTNQLNQTPALQHPTESSVPSKVETVPSDPSAANRYNVPPQRVQQAQYYANPAATMPAVYQVPAANGPNRYDAARPAGYQQGPSDQPPAYYPPQAASPSAAPGAYNR